MLWCIHYVHYVVLRCAGRSAEDNLDLYPRALAEFARVVRRRPAGRMVLFVDSDNLPVPSFLP